MGAYLLGARWGLVLTRQLIPTFLLVGFSSGLSSMSSQYEALLGDSFRLMQSDRGALPGRAMTLMDVALGGGPAHLLTFGRFAMLPSWDAAVPADT